MRIDITKIAGNEGATMEVSENVSAEDLGHGVAGVEIDGDVQVCLKITYTEGIVHSLGTASGTYSAQCARCLKDVKRDFVVDIDENFVNEHYNMEEDNESLYEYNENLYEGSESSYEDSESSYEDSETSYEYSGTIIDFTDALRDNILLSLPIIVLCEQSCKGLCEICGNNLNEKDCGCVKENIDIRMEKLKDFFKE